MALFSRSLMVWTEPLAYARFRRARARKRIHPKLPLYSAILAAMMIANAYMTTAKAAGAGLVGFILGVGVCGRVLLFVVFVLGREFYSNGAEDFGLSTAR